MVASIWSASLTAILMQDCAYPSVTTLSMIFSIGSKEFCEMSKYLPCFDLLLLCGSCTWVLKLSRVCSSCTLGHYPHFNLYVQLGICLPILCFCDRFGFRVFLVVKVSVISIFFNTLGLLHIWFLKFINLVHFTFSDFLSFFTCVWEFDILVVFSWCKLLLL